jgi:hypothetical protein
MPRPAEIHRRLGYPVVISVITPWMLNVKRCILLVND